MVVLILDARIPLFHFRFKRGREREILSPKPQTPKPLPYFPIPKP